MLQHEIHSQVFNVACCVQYATWELARGRGYTNTINGSEAKVYPSFPLALYDLWPFFTLHL